MKKQTLFCLLLGLLVLSGCTPKRVMIADDLGLEVAEDIAWEDREAMTPAERAVLTPEERFRHDYSMAALARMRENEAPLNKKPLLKKAKTALGTPYVRGGTNLSGFDCSGFVQWAYKSVGVTLPRTAREQSYVGKAIDVEEMAAGDIVAFRHPRRGYHTGIYVGNGKFIHSPRTNKSVEINSLNDPYFSSTFLGARRVRVSEADAAEAEHLLAAYESGKHRQQRIRSDASVLSRSKENRTTSQRAVSSRDKKKTESARAAVRSTERKTASNKEKGRTVATKQEKKSPPVPQTERKTERANKQTPSPAQKKASTPEKKRPVASDKKQAVSAEKKQSVDKKQAVASDKKQGSSSQKQTPTAAQKKSPAPQRTAAPQKKAAPAPASKSSEKNVRK